MIMSTNDRHEEERESEENHDESLVFFGVSSRKKTYSDWFLSDVNSIFFFSVNNISAWECPMSFSFLSYSNVKSHWKSQLTRPRRRRRRLYSVPEETHRWLRLKKKKQQTEMQMRRELTQICTKSIEGNIFQCCLRIENKWWWWWSDSSLFFMFVSYIIELTRCRWKQGYRRRRAHPIDRTRRLVAQGCFSVSSSESTSIRECRSSFTPVFHPAWSIENETTTTKSTNCSIEPTSIYLRQLRHAE